MPQIKIQVPDTDKWKIITISEAQFKALRDLNEGKTTHDKLLLQINNLDINDQIKTFLENLIETSIKIGSTTINLGKKIVKTILYIVKNYPKAMIGSIIGYILGTLASKIPVIGWVLKSILVPIGTLVGAGYGVKRDFSDKKLADGVKEKIKQTFFGVKDIQV